MPFFCFSKKKIPENLDFDKKQVLNVSSLRLLPLTLTVISCLNVRFLLTNRLPFIRNHPQTKVNGFAWSWSRLVITKIWFIFFNGIFFLTIFANLFYHHKASQNLLFSVYFLFIGHFSFCFAVFFFIQENNLRLFRRL